VIASGSWRLLSRSRVYNNDEKKRWKYKKIHPVTSQPILSPVFPHELIYPLVILTVVHKNRRAYTNILLLYESVWYCFERSPLATKGENRFDKSDSSVTHCCTAFQRLCACRDGLYWWIECEPVHRTAKT